MKKIIEKLKNLLNRVKWSKFLLGVLTLTIIGGLFYWYEIRLSNIYVRCNEKALEFFKDSQAEGAYDLFYKICLRSEGINK